MQLPLQPRLSDYRGSDPKKRRKADEHNAMAQRVVDHINTLIANDQAAMQQYLWYSVARDLKLTVEQVESAVMYGGHNGITVGVSEEGRRALAAYKK
ncbi:hypothetical protein EDE08_103528 [Bradyrhizobium sp. R2.2-H]|jgi:hypothetical protein|uniref:hypothetical protein n=1 Tax=unclassified Bradyrhizobium TaxID=2631580 RepID=UPI001043207E|nr:MULTISPECIES: hypothetical protein [unclassified Bradyrhizobium]TCU75308.1 hypothetical protein EDE10_103527 [Bradyrhizobium sp. Y-H1]TCU78076.1 hypothetical protein EDE08_103528 [Bradyrhizobium sp. R2.2-H]